MNNTRIDGDLSDLFFNHTHEEYDSLFRLSKEGPEQDEIEQAILADAKDFVECYGRIGRIGYFTPEEYAQDFLGRL